MNFYDDSKEKIWLERLRQEFVNLNWEFNLNLPEPSFSISSDEKPLASWDHVKMVITVSKKLIQDNPWEISKEIFKLQIAKALTSYSFYQDSFENKFDRACARLAVESWAKTPNIEMSDELPYWRNQKLSDKDQRIQQKVEKLLALSSSSNENEALLAMKMVKNLLKKYNIESLHTGKDTDYVSAFVTHHKKRMESFSWAICHILEDHYFVKVIQSDIFHAEKLEKYKTFEITGTRNNVLMAEYVYWFLYRKVLELWKDFAKEYGKKGAVAKNNYLRGLLKGFAEKLGQAEQYSSEDSSAEKGLIVLANQKLENYLMRKYPKLGKTSGSQASLDLESYQAGVSEGKNITITQPIHESKNQGLFLKS